MKIRLLFSLSVLVSALLFAAAAPASASPGKARIVRLSYVQGEVSFARSASSDPLADQHIAWEAAVVNLPIRQGYVLATLQGRAEVEFESGATAYLAENTVLEFYDLSLNDGARITRLVLRQGTASFHVQPARGDFFSVTGADFTAQADGRSVFRMENFDDASTIGVSKGRVQVAAKTLSTELKSGESLAFGAGEAAIPPVGQLQAKDEFDNWVSRRADSVQAAAASSLTYVSSPYYSSGFADMYTYGGWFPYAGYGYGWRPFGVGLGWSPFSTGRWIYDPFFGWTWVSYEPWGWLPYHFGSWIFAPAQGWIWVPSGFTGWGAPPVWRPSTAVWVRSAGQTGIVPVHPLDTRGKTPINLTQGVIGTSGVPIRIAEGDSGNARRDWKVLKSPPRDAVQLAPAAGAPPVRVSRTLAAIGVANGQQGSSIQYDPKERRFVNSNAPSATGQAPVPAPEAVRSATPPAAVRSAVPPAAVNAGSGEAAMRSGAPAGAAPAPRVTPPPPAPLRTYTPPPAPRSSSGSAMENQSRSGGSRANSGADRMPRSDRPAPRSSEPRSAPAPRSSPAPRHAQSPPQSHPH